MESVDKMQSFSDSNSIKSIPEFKYVQNLDGIDELIACGDSEFLSRCVIPTIKSLCEYDDKNRIVISTTLRPLSYAIKNGFSTSAVSSLDDSVLQVIMKLELKPSDVTKELQNIVLESKNDRNPEDLYFKLGRFPSYECDSVCKIHEFMYGNDILPVWWNDDLDLYRALIRCTRVWENPFYVANFRYVTYEDARRIVKRGSSWVNLFAFLWSECIKDTICEVVPRRMCDELDSFYYATEQNSQWFAIDFIDKCYTIPIYNYYQFKDKVVSIIQEYGVSAVFREKLASGTTLRFARADEQSVVMPYWYCSILKAECTTDDLPVVTYTKKVFNLIGCNSEYSDFDIVSRIYPAISRVFFICSKDSNKNLAEELQVTLTRLEGGAS